MTEPRLLYLAHRIPFPPDKGDKIRSWRTVEHLAKRFRVHLAAFVDRREDFQHAERLRAVCDSVVLVPLAPHRATLRSAAGFLTGEPLTMPYYRDRRMTAAVAAARALGLSIEMAFSSSMAQHLSQSSSAPRVVDLCDADSAKWTEYARRKNWPMSAVYAREGRRLSAVETEIINWADATFAISEEEADLLASRDGVKKEALWFCNGVDSDYFSPRVGDGIKSSVVFTGAMDYWANVDAVVWFMREIWPAVRASAPTATFTIVGSNPTKEICSLDGKEGVAVAGRVKDVRPYLAGAAVVVAPMRIARGVQNKVLEAMAMGKAVVTTPAGLEGIDAKMGTEAITAASPDAFAHEILRLISDDRTAAALGAAARARVVADYRWPTQLARLDAVIDRLLAQKKSHPASRSM